MIFTVEGGLTKHVKKTSAAGEKGHYKLDSLTKAKPTLPVHGL